MKRILPILLAVLLLASACKPVEQDKVNLGSEDGGGSGYGTDIKSVLELSDFYSIVSGSNRDNNLLMLGTPVFVLAESDTYILKDGSQVVLTYSNSGALTDTLYTEFDTGLSYSLFDKLHQLGVLVGSGSTNDNPTQPDNTPNPPDTPTTPSTDSDIVYPIFSKQNYRLSTFEGKLSLYLNRSSIISTFGYPNYFKGRTYQKDSYIIDCYALDDGSILMLDYGYDRVNLRCAAIQGADGVTSGYLGSWSMQAKPADFVRRRISLSSVTSLLAKGKTAADVYKILGEPGWYEGTTAKYRDAYVLEDGSTVYLSYEEGHTTLLAAHRQTTDGQLLEVTLR